MKLSKNNTLIIGSWVVTFKNGDFSVFGRTFLETRNVKLSHLHSAQIDLDEEYDVLLKIVNREVCMFDYFNSF